MRYALHFCGELVSSSHARGRWFETSRAHSKEAVQREPSCRRADV
jgi:hypothetical protein